MKNCTFLVLPSVVVDHGRDKLAAIAEIMGEFSEMMENKLQALNWVSQIKDHKPR